MAPKAPATCRYAVSRQVRAAPPSQRHHLQYSLSGTHTVVDSLHSPQPLLRTQVADYGWLECRAVHQARQQLLFNKRMPFVRSAKLAYVRSTSLC